MDALIAPAASGGLGARLAMLRWRRQAFGSQAAARATLAELTACVRALRTAGRALGRRERELARARARLTAARRRTCDLVEVAAAASEAQRLGEREERRDRFLALLGHELRSPLAAIAMAVDLATVAPGAASVAQLAALAPVATAVASLRELLEGLLESVRARHGKAVLAHEPVELVATIGEAIAACGMAFAERGVVLRRRGPAALTVEGDRDRLRELFVSMLACAASKVARGGELEVALVELDRVIQLTLRDAADDAHDAAALCRAAPDALELGQALDVRIALAQHVVALHHGSLRVARRVGGLGRVTLRLPRTTPAP